MTRYYVGDVATKARHPDAPVFPTATQAALYILANDLDAGWWPLPEDDDPQPARLGGIA